MSEVFVKQLFDYLNSCVDHHLQNATNLKELLGFLAKFQSPVSIRNKLLTFGYNPGATDIHTKDEWLKFGISVLDEDAVIYNLQKNPESELGYEERIMYDISSTDATRKSFEVFPDASFLAERLLISSPCPVKFRESLIDGNRKSGYDPDKRIIEVTSGFKDEEQVCYGLLREYAHFYFHEDTIKRNVERGRNHTKGDSVDIGSRGNGDSCQYSIGYDREKHLVEAQAVSYALCVRYDITPSPLDVVSPPEGKPEDRMEILKGLDSVIEMISKRIEEGGRQQRRFLNQENATVDKGNLTDSEKTQSTGNVHTSTVQRNVPEQGG